MSQKTCPQCGTLFNTNGLFITLCSVCQQTNALMAAQERTFRQSFVDDYHLSSEQVISYPTIDEEKQKEIDRINATPLKNLAISLIQISIPVFLLYFIFSNMFFLWGMYLAVPAILLSLGTYEYLNKFKGSRL